MEWVIIAAAVGATLAFGAVLWRERRGSGDAPERGIASLRVGDVCEAADERLAVEELRRFADEDGARRWTTYKVSDRDGDDEPSRWLTVEGDDELIAHLYVRVPRETLMVSPDVPDTLTVEGVTYHLEAMGTALVRRQEAGGERDLGKCRYADYREVGGDRALALEWWGDTPDVATGVRIAPESVRVVG